MKSKIWTVRTANGLQVQVGDIWKYTQGSAMTTGTVYTAHLLVLNIQNVSNIDVLNLTDGNFRVYSFGQNSINYELITRL